MFLCFKMYISVQVFLFQITALTQSVTTIFSKSNMHSSSLLLKFQSFTNLWHAQMMTVLHVSATVKHKEMHGSLVRKEYAISLKRNFKSYKEIKEAIMTVNFICIHNFQYCAPKITDHKCTFVFLYCWKVVHYKATRIGCIFHTSQFPFWINYRILTPSKYSHKSE